MREKRKAQTLAIAMCLAMGTGIASAEEFTFEGEETRVAALDGDADHVKYTTTNPENETPGETTGPRVNAAGNTTTFNADTTTITNANGTCVKGYDHDAVAAAATGHVLKIYIAHYREIATAAYLVRTIIKVDLQDSFGTLAYLYVSHIDILDYSAAARVGLDTYHTVKARAVHDAVFCIKIAASSGYFTSYHHTSVTVAHLAVTYYYVFGWASPQASVIVAPAFDGDAVIACVEIAVFNKHSVA